MSSGTCSSAPRTPFSPPRSPCRSRFPGSSRGTRWRCPTLTVASHGPEVGRALSPLIAEARRLDAGTLYRLGKDGVEWRDVLNAIEGMRDECE